METLFQRLFSERKKRYSRLESVLNNTIESLESARSKSTIANYHTAVNSFFKYANQDITVRKVNIHLIEGYEQWMKQEGIVRNTSSCYMRCLRSVFNQAGIKNTNALFKTVFTGNAKTVKRALEKEDIKHIRQLNLNNDKTLALSRDLCMFSFNAMGMPFVDMAYLRKEQLQDGFIVYERRKTGKQIRVELSEALVEIINRYAREDSPYLLPILTTTDAKAAMRQYESKLHQYNCDLKRLAKKVGLSNLTSYQTRHSWASIAYDKGVNLAVISKALGHSNLNTTMIYIQDIKDSKVAEANRIVCQMTFLED